MDDDVRNLAGRATLAMIAVGCGLAGAYGAHRLLDAVTHACPTGFGGCMTGQYDWFRIASDGFAFVLCGVAGGGAYEAIRRRWSSRTVTVPVLQIAIPRAVVRVRRRDRALT